MSVHVVKSSPAATKEQKKRKKGAGAHTLRRVLLVFRPYTKRVVLILLTILASTALNLVIPLFIPRIIDDALPRHDVHLLILYGSLMTCAAILSGLIGVGQTYLSNYVGQRVMRDLRNMLYAHLQNLSLSFFTSMHTGEIQSRLSNDVSSAQSTVTDTFVGLLSNVVVVLGTIVVMFYLNPLLTLVSFIIVPLYVFLSARVGAARRRSVEATQQSLAGLTALMQETLSISGILLIKTFGRKHLAQDQFEEKNQQLMDLSIAQQMLGRWFVMLITTFITLLPVILYMAAGFLIIYTPGGANITTGTLIAFVTVEGMFFGPFVQLSFAFINVQGSLALFDRIFEYLDHEVEIKDAPDARYLSRAQVRGDVVFRNVSFGYNKNASTSQQNGAKSSRWKKDSVLKKTAARATLRKLSFLRWDKDSMNEEAAPRATLRNLSFSARSGQLIALVGPSGAGKTTITYLVSRLYDVDSGAIEIDGHDIRKIAMESLEDLIGVVMQESYLFHSTIRENLLYVRPEATDAEIVAATKAAAIHDRILELDHGYDTMVGERGYKLSGGEKQRVAIARMLLKDPKILILDEATSALDTTSERLIQRALEPLMKGRTTLAIAHRLSTILAADLILVLDKGEIIEQGTHDELLQLGGVYAGLYNQQFAYEAYQAHQA